jgi:uncharacterized short protein YbdD (DUF466 family)
VTSRLRAALCAFWRRLREWSGDAAYETYLARVGSREPLSREAFYLDGLRRRYQSSQPDRCC